MYFSSKQEELLHIKAVTYREKKLRTISRTLKDFSAKVYK